MTVDAIQYIELRSVTINVKQIADFDESTTIKASVHSDDPPSNIFFYIGASVTIHERCSHYSICTSRKRLEVIGHLLYLDQY